MTGSADNRLLCRRHHAIGDPQPFVTIIRPPTLLRYRIVSIPEGRD